MQRGIMRLSQIPGWQSRRKDNEMKYGTRIFLVVKGKIRRIGVDRFSRISSEAMPEYAGLKIPYALLVFEREEGSLGDLRYCTGGYLVFDKKGKVDESSQWSNTRLAMAGEDNPKSFGARRAEQVRTENTWNPKGEQLNHMIALVKKNG
jgi:hypothetical protein